jgi:serine/threonine protein kinase
MHAVKTPDTEPIPGYRLLEPLGRGGYGEVWKCVAPGGLAKAIKFVPTGDSIVDVGCAATQELRALKHIKEIRHPFLLSIERVELIDGELAIVMELADRSLHDLLQDYMQRSQTGIPRFELISYFRDAAEALDLLNQEYGLQHLDVKPRNLFVVGRHAKVADFGLINSLAEIHSGGSEAVELGVATPLYSAPETFLGRITLFSDQYSLAVSYCELLTGVPPFSGKSFNQLAVQHTSAAPDVNHLPEHDQPVVARALSKEPSERFPSCQDFVRALESAAPALPPPGSRSVRNLKGISTSTGKPPEMTTISVSLPSAPTPSPTVTTAPPVAPSASLANYQFLECLARLSVGEVWRARDANGGPCLIKLVFGCQAVEETINNGAVARLRLLRHDAVAPFVVIRDGPNRIALISDEHDGTLADRLLEQQSAGHPGLPRAEILKHLWRAAEAFDDLYDDHGLQHLLLNPRSLVLDGEKVRVLDFGLGQLIWLPAGLDPTKVNTRYAAPEVLEGQRARSTDQFSLALIYQELLTGVHAFRNLSPRQLASPRLRGQPQVEALPAIERAIVLRALAPEPDSRFPTCCDFILALKEIGARETRPPRPSSGVVRVVNSTIVPAATPLPPRAPSSKSKEVLRKLLRETMGKTGVQQLKGFRYREVPGVSMEHSFVARFLPGSLAIKLEGFRRHWIGKVISTGDTEKVYHITPPVQGFKRLLGKVPTLQMRVTHGNWPDASTPVPFRVTLEPLPGGEHLLQELGPRIFDSVRSFLQAEPDRRHEERFQLGKLLRVSPVFDNDVGEGIVAQGVDISGDGLALFLPCRPQSTELLLDLSCGNGPPLMVPARIVRSEACPDGRYRIGVAFDESNSNGK